MLKRIPVIALFVLASLSFIMLIQTFASPITYAPPLPTNLPNFQTQPPSLTPCSNHWSPPCSTARATVTEVHQCPVFHDGRINHCDTFTPVVLYGKPDSSDNWGLDVYAGDGSGLLVSIMAYTIAAVPTCPANNTLIFSDSTTGINLYRLTERSDGTCPFQLNAPSTEAGKTYIIIFDELYPNTHYESHEEVISP